MQTYTILINVPDHLDQRFREVLTGRDDDAILAAEKAIRDCMGDDEDDMGQIELGVPRDQHGNPIDR